MLNVLPSLRLTRLKLVWMSVQITNPRLIKKLITQDIGTVLESLSHLCPELGKVILDLLFIVIETLPTVRCKTQDQQTVYIESNL